uniref:G_PROTEIN_RECEP_F1_2 domain-containing protein n=1 Tax=Meloidogyne hapla TaxID=6305 RepID=A0A1I8BWS6_MELHA
MAFNFPPGPNYTETETKIFLAADILELAANSLLACPISTINFILILKTSILHPNLKLILLCQSLCIFIRGIGRALLNIFRIYLNDVGSVGQSALSAISTQSIAIRNCIMHVIVIERIIATFKSETYEKRRSVLFHFVWMTITYYKLFCGGFFFVPKNGAVCPIDDINGCNNTNNTKLKQVDIHGRTLISEKKEEAIDFHFKQLAISWK